MWFSQVADQDPSHAAGGIARVLAVAGGRVTYPRLRRQRHGVRFGFNRFRGADRPRRRDARRSRFRESGFLHAVGQAGAGGTDVRIPGKQIPSLSDRLSTTNTNTRSHTIGASIPATVEAKPSRARGYTRAAVYALSPWVRAHANTSVVTPTNLNSPTIRSNFKMPSLRAKYSLINSRTARKSSLYSIGI
jgi:hypothetical protein